MKKILRVFPIAFVIALLMPAMNLHGSALFVHPYLPTWKFSVMLIMDGGVTMLGIVLVMVGIYTIVLWTILSVLVVGYNKLRNR